MIIGSLLFEASTLLWIKVGTGESEMSVCLVHRTRLEGWEAFAAPLVLEEVDGSAERS